MIPMQSVPTSVAVGPDGAYYVGELTGFPFPVGGANIYRVETGSDPEVYASGFTNVLDLTFDPYGNLFVVEMFTNGLLSGDPAGAVIQVMPDDVDNRVVLASEGLITPSAVAVGPAGALYVSNFGTSAEEGQVVRVMPASQGNFEVIAIGLNNPRGLEFGPGGGLYVAEAGAGGEGPCFTNPEGFSCVGLSGSVTRLLAGPQERVVTELVSMGLENTGDFGLGPHDVAFDEEGNLKLIVGLGGNPALRDPGGPLGDQGGNFAQFVTGHADGTWTNEVDLGDYEAANNPDEGLPDTNPFGLLKVDDGYVVADAGANALLHIDNSGTVSTLAVFPDREVEFPPDSGDMVPMQAVPTSIALGPDGAYYVGQLTGFPFPVGGANVYRVPAEGGDPEIHASGFTNITHITFDDAGNLYVVEMFTNGLLSGDPTGAVIRVAPDGSRKVLASEGLVTPAGVTVAPDGEIYVSNYGTSAGLGQVVRIVERVFTLYFPAIHID
jgi:glucose/arabinose dehydrogenase